MNDFHKQEGGSLNAGKAALLREGMTLKSVSATNNDSQFVQLAQFTRQDIGLLFGLDSIPGDGDSNSYNTMEQKYIAYKIALDRWLRKFEEQCDMKLLSEKEINRGNYYHKFNRASIMATDLLSTMNAFSIGVTSRILNPNECRSKLDMNPYEGGDEFENPAISPGAPGDEESPEKETEDDVSENKSSETESPTNRLAAEETIRSLIKREANNAISASARGNFVSWIDKNYPKWESKLSDKLEAIGLDRDAARVHCEKSVEELIQLATSSEPQDLQSRVKQLVGTWEHRAPLFFGGIK
jgi:hypothetical protein